MTGLDRRASRREPGSGSWVWGSRKRVRRRCAARLGRRLGRQSARTHARTLHSHDRCRRLGDRSCPARVRPSAHGPAESPSQRLYRAGQCVPPAQPALGAGDGRGRPGVWGHVVVITLASAGPVTAGLCPWGLFWAQPLSPQGELCGCPHAGPCSPGLAVTSLWPAPHTPPSREPTLDLMGRL